MYTFAVFTGLHSTTTLQLRSIEVFGNFGLHNKQMNQYRYANVLQDRYTVNFKQNWLYKSVGILTCF